MKNQKLKIAMLIIATVFLVAGVAIAGYMAITGRVQVPSSESGLVTVPEIVGSNIEQAKDKAESAGLVLDIDQWVQSKTHPINQVVSQRPLPGDKAEKGSAVVITISGGKTCGAQTKTTNKAIIKLEDIKPLPTPPIQPRKSILKKIVVIDPGHQSKANLDREPVGPGASEEKMKVTGGAAGVSSRTPEYKIVLQISQKLKAKLKAQGVNVVMTREENDINLSNVQRAEIANNVDADLFIRVHNDSNTDPKKSGISTLYPESNKWTAPIYAESLKAARVIHDSMIKQTKRKDNGLVPRNDITGFNWSKVPVVLVETGFLSNPEEDALLNSPEYQELLASAISEGVISYLQK